MNKWLVIPIFNWLDGWGWSYGIIILVLTIAIKMLLMPLTWKNFVSSAKMRLLKPELDEINGKYKPEDALKKQQAQMDLYRKAGVNPANGCVPLLIQMPVLYAMFRFFPASIELRQQAFLWADDLSSYDSILDLPFAIPAYGEPHEPLHHPDGGQHHDLHGHQQQADAAAARHAEHEADDVPVPGDDVVLHEQPSLGLELLLPAGQRDQHPADDPVQALVRERGQDPRTTGAEHEDAEEEEQVAAALGGHAETTAGRTPEVSPSGQAGSGAFIIADSTSMAMAMNNRTLDEHLMHLRSAIADQPLLLALQGQPTRRRQQYRPAARHIGDRTGQGPTRIPRPWHRQGA